MFTHMNGRQLAGWGYGLVWVSVLVEFINVLFGATRPGGESPLAYAIGLAFALAFTVTGVRMLMLIKHRPW